MSILLEIHKMDSIIAEKLQKLHGPTAQLLSIGIMRRLFGLELMYKTMEIMDIIQTSTMLTYNLVCNKRKQYLRGLVHIQLLLGMNQLMSLGGIHLSHF